MKISYPPFHSIRHVKSDGAWATSMILGLHG